MPYNTPAHIKALSLIPTTSQHRTRRVDFLSQIIAIRMDRDDAHVQSVANAIKHGIEPPDKQAELPIRELLKLLWADKVN